MLDNEYTHVQSAYEYNLYNLTNSTKTALSKKSDKVKTKMSKKAQMEPTAEASGEYYDGGAKSDTGSAGQGYQYAEAQQYAA